MSKFYLEITCNNSAFDPDTRPEIVKLLTEVTTMISAYAQLPVHIFDTNGNRVGSANLIPSKSDVKL